MSAQILFFEKNKIDISNPDMVVTASEADEFAHLALNRQNRSAWVTTDSADANNTTFEVDMVDEHTIDAILLIKHNFKSFEVHYWNLDTEAWDDFDLEGTTNPIDETTNAEETTYYAVEPVTTTKVRITIRGTMVADSDKSLAQFIVTQRIGQLNGYPKIGGAKHDKNRQTSKMLSGKMNVTEAVGGFFFDLSCDYLKDSDDLDIVERLYSSPEGFLVWLCGGDEDQFASRRIGYRLEDIYLMRCVNDYAPNWYKGFYNTGLDIKLAFAEVVD